MLIKINVKNKTNNPDINISTSIDATGLFCPAPMAMLKIGLEEVKNYEIVEIIADDPEFEKDLPSWCDSTGNELLFLEIDEKGILFGYVKKKK